MNIADISTQLIYTTVPIFSKKDNNTVSTGTGFLLSIKESPTASIPLLITNYHVLENSLGGFFEFHLGENGLPSGKSLRIHFDKLLIEENKLGNLDLVAIPLAAVLDNLQSKKVELFYRSVSPDLIPPKQQIDNLSALEEIIFIGYPSGIQDNVNKLSIIRRGITATPIWNKYNGLDEFLIDAGVYPGSSGSPVFIYNHGSYTTGNTLNVGSRLFFVGVISQTMLRKSNTGSENLNLGVVINSWAMYREIESLIARLKSKKHEMIS